jgi:histidine triad (HIT) family protein
VVTDRAGDGRRERQADCLFCRIVDGEIASTAVAGMPGQPATPAVIAIRDVTPQAPTHVLLISREHIPSAADLHPEDGDLLGQVFALAASIAAREGIADSGYRVVTNIGAHGGQSVEHLHFHLIGGRAMTWPPG